MGKVSERASAFLTSNTQSESSLTAEMQKKYLEQMQSGSLKQNKLEKSTDENDDMDVVEKTGTIKEARTPWSYRPMVMGGIWVPYM